MTGTSHHGRHMSSNVSIVLSNLYNNDVINNSFRKSWEYFILWTSLANLKKNLNHFTQTACYSNKVMIVYSTTQHASVYPQ